MTWLKNHIIYRTLSWRITAFCTTCTISYIVTGSLEVAGTIGVIELIAKWFLHFLHDSIWKKFEK